MADQNVIRGMLLGFFAFTIFTIGDAMIKHIGGIYHPTQIIVTTAFFSLLLISVFSSKLGGFRDTIKHKRAKWMWARGIGMALQAPLGIYAFAHLPFTKAYTLFFVAPFVTALLAVIILKEEMGWRRWLTIFVGFVGVLIALRPGVIEVEPAAFAALGAGSLAALSWIFVRFIGGEQTLMSYSFYPCVSMLVLMSAPALLNFKEPTMEHLLMMALIGGIGTVGVIALSIAFQMAPPANISSLHYTQIIFGVIWGYLFFDEMPDIWTFVGSAVIIASGLFIVYREHVKKKMVTDFETQF